MTRKALGRGLKALIPESKAPEGGALLQLDVERILPGRSQPRHDFDEGAIGPQTGGMNRPGDRRAPSTRLSEDQHRDIGACRPLGAPDLLLQGGRVRKKLGNG